MPPIEAEQLSLFPVFDMAYLKQARAELAAAVPEATKRSYEHDWRHFRGWCEAVGRASLPASDETLSLYLCYCARECKFKTATIERRIWGVAWAHQRAGHVWRPGADAHAVMSAIARELGREQRRMAALSAAEVSQMASTLPQTRAGHRDRALLLIGFSLGVRASTLVGLQLADVTRSGRGLLVRVRREKNDQEAVGRSIGIMSPDCVSAFDVWVRVRGSAPGRLFGCCDKWVRLVVKAGCVRIGLDASKYSSHSLRAGMITALDAAGVSLPRIKERSGHRSLEMVARYVRDRQAFANDPLATRFDGLAPMARAAGD